MVIDKMLASISADTSLIEEKLNRLFEVFPKHFSDELLGMVSGLLNHLVFVDGPVAVGAGGTLDIVCIFDFDSAAYDQIMTAARAFKVDLTHK
jgi:hypothetical protein